MATPLTWGEKPRLLLEPAVGQNTPLRWMGETPPRRTWGLLEQINNCPEGRTTRAHLPHRWGVRTRAVEPGAQTSLGVVPWRVGNMDALV